MVVVGIQQINFRGYLAVERDLYVPSAAGDIKRDIESVVRFLEHQLIVFGIVAQSVPINSVRPVHLVQGCVVNAVVIFAPYEVTGAAGNLDRQRFAVVQSQCFKREYLVALQVGGVGQNFVVGT